MARKISDVMFTTLRMIVKASTGRGNRGFKVAEAEASFGSQTIAALEERRLIMRRRVGVGRASTPITFFRPTDAGFELAELG